jgi:myo-inositol-1(or 4)-monophosphatase
VTSPEPAELLAIAEEAARAAGGLLLERFGEGRSASGEITSKSTSTDLVSESDLAAEATIRAILESRRPDDAIMGEEGDDKPGTTGLRWIVDPLDGTINFLFGIPIWCVSVACEGVAGVVFDPNRDELFATPAVAGGSPTCNGEPIGASLRDELGRTLLATGFGYDSEVRRSQAAVVARILPVVRDIRRAGSAALDLAWCAAGRLDAYYEYGVKPWDVAAGRLLCTAAGLEVHDLPGGDGLPPGIMTAPPATAAELLALLG